MTLGVVLGGPDPQRMRSERCSAYRRVTLADPRLRPVRDAMIRGVADGVFALQLHGMEHFWPPSVLARSQGDSRIRSWLTEGAFAATEDLPSPLQSRWVDSAELPSRPLPEDEAIAAATEETQAFADIFGAIPEVVVPATFVWNDAVERAWIRSGVRVVVTPGVRNESRDERGTVVPGPHAYVNGQPASEEAIYVVRDAYFEPSLGHDHQAALAALRARTRTGRPTLFEMHRLNFVRDAAGAQKALEELTALLNTALQTYPTIRFMSTAELAGQYGQTLSLVDRRPRIRVHFLIRRLARVARLRKLAWATGAAFPAWLAYVLTRPAGWEPAGSPA